MSQAYRVLRIAFESRAELLREWEANLANGGLFLPRQLDLLYDEPVMVLLDLPFAERAIELEGRVVQTIPVEFEANGGRAGAALELNDTPQEIRACLEEAIGARLVEERDSGQGERHAQRSVAQVRARVVEDGRDIEGRTHNLSLAGVLVAIADAPAPVGQDVLVEIVHPTSGDPYSIPGRIARHDVDGEGVVRGLGIQFAVEPEREAETEAFLNQVKAVEHARRLGGVAGSIDTLGLNDLILSFGQCVPSGRFTLTQRGQIGTIHVAGGMMTSAQMGAAIGVKALVRMATWQDGEFEFHANLEADVGAPTMVMPIEAALLEAARLLDEDGPREAAPLPRHAIVCATRRDGLPGDASKLESEVLALAAHRASVSRILGTIQEPDAVVERTILDLVERDIVRLEKPASRPPTPQPGMPA